jgi:hypothetical protein
MIRIEAAQNVKLAVTVFALSASALVGCGSDPGGDTGDTGGTAALDTPAKIEGFLEGRPLVMEGDDIPSHPNGYLQDANFEAATQCYHRVQMALTGTTFNVVSALGTLKDAPNPGDVGTCDRSTPAGPELKFDSKTYLVENVQGDAECFDFTITYTGFGQEGRGRITEDRSVVELELYFSDQAAGISCADGPPGSDGVTLKEKPFEGDSVQVYRVQ